MSIRPWCEDHQRSPENIGNDRILFPTDYPIPDRDPNGWYELDMSELSCPEQDEEGSCQNSWKWQVSC